jgi:type I restriction enzyme S subunit
MGLKPGYKETEIGVIPKDWEVSSLGGCLADRPTYGINAPAVPYSDRLPVYLRITDITEEGYFEPDPPVSVRSESSKNYWLNEGDIVFARTGASVGKSYQYRSADGPLVYAGFLIRVRPDDQRLLPTFLAAYVTTGRYWQWVRLMSMRSGQPGINGNEYSQLPISLPPLCEQRAIATALSDVDALLEGLDRLIAKKRDLKQAAMQQLLTGQTRLPGFEGEWEEKQLGELGYFLKGSGVRRDEAQSGSLPCIRYGEIYTVHHDVVREFHSWISMDVAKMAVQIQKGDLLFAGSGETKDEIGKCVAVVTDKEAYAGGDIVILRAPTTDPVFMGYALNHPAVNLQKSRFGQGDAVVHISASALSQIVITLPEETEQRPIATVLADMDGEIETLKKRRAKTAALKQAMMQELLTGRTRLL